MPVAIAIDRCGELLGEIEARQGARDGLRQEGDLPPLTRTETARTPLMRLGRR